MNGNSRAVVMQPGPVRRRQGSSCVRTAIFIFIVTFLWLQLHMANLSGVGRGGGKSGASSTADTESSLQQFLSVVPPHLHKFLVGQNYSQNSTTTLPPPLVNNITAIKAAIRHLNGAQVVLNEDAFGPLQTDSLVIVVQVIDDDFYFIFLVRDLRNYGQQADISRRTNFLIIITPMRHTLNKILSVE
jgi:hypothetical protein